MDRNQFNDEQLDSLMRQMFGEAEPGDAEILEAVGEDRLDSERTILYHLREELRGLREVPECQLTTERMRAAILNPAGGAPRKPMFANWFRVALPVAACAAIGAWAVFGAKPSVESPTADVPVRVAQSDPTEQVEVAPDEAVTSSVIPKVSQEGTAKVQTPAVRERNKPRRVRTRLASNSSRIPTGLTAIGDAAVASLASTTVLRSSGGTPGTGGGNPSASVANKAADALESFGESTELGSVADKVVVVGGGSQLDSRASSATEVDKRNVVFGG